MKCPKCRAGEITVEVDAYAYFPVADDGRVDYDAEPEITTFDDRTARCSVCEGEFELQDPDGDGARVVVPAVGGRADMIHCPCGAGEFRAVQKALLGIIVTVDEDGAVEFQRQDSDDGVRPNVLDCDKPEDLTCIACGREFDRRHTVRGKRRGCGTGGAAP